MSTTQTQSLIAGHQYALKICLQNLKHLQKTFDELETAKTQLKTLPNKIRHDIMVPFGVSNPSTPPLMLMEGTIQHTNEIMVLLGDNWFVERSAKEAIDIIKRRQTKIKVLIDKFSDDKGKHEKWLEMIQSLYGQGGGYTEINEKCDEEEEKRWREVHRQKVREHKQREAAERAKINKSHEEMMKRLDELEIRESQPLMSSLKSGNRELNKSVKFDETVDEPKFLDECDEISERPEKDERDERRNIFSGEVVERRIVGEKKEGEGNRGEEEAEVRSAPLRDPPHKDQPPQPAKKVSQFKLARQSR